MQQPSSTNTYSLRAILYSDLDPTLCKLMLHEIKSPLLEHSFQLTTDDYGTQRSYEYRSFDNIDYQKKSNLKSKREYQYSWEVSRRLEDLSIAQSEYIHSKRSQNIKKNATARQNERKVYFLDPVQYIAPPPIKEHPLEPIDAEGMVSPLEYNSRMTNKHHDSFVFDGKRFYNIGAFCGDIFDPKYAYKHEVIVEFGNRVHRKKIFQKKYNNKVRNYPISPTRNYYVHFREAVQKLNNINELYTARFVEFLWKILELFRKSTPYTSFLSQNEDKVSRILLYNNPVDYYTRETIANKNRIINRLSSNKISYVLTKIVSFEKFKYSPPLQNIVQDSRVYDNIGKTLAIYSYIYEIIEGYVSQQTILDDLDKIYDIIYSEYIDQLPSPQTPPTPISSLQPLASTESKIVPNILNVSLSQKLSTLLHSLKIDPQLFDNLDRLTYIWSNLLIRGSYSPSNLLGTNGKYKFINELCKNDLLVHQHNRYQRYNLIERKLSYMGFVRNTD